MELKSLLWFQRKKRAQEEAERLVLEELQGIRKLLRKQSVLMEEVRQGQEALAVEASERPEPLMELCDAIFYLHRAFQHPGLMSRQHAQVLSMVLNRLHRFAASLDLTILLEEGVPFDTTIHEAVANRSPGAPSLDVLEVVQPGYVRKQTVLRPAKVIVGTAGDWTLPSEGSTPS